MNDYKSVQDLIVKAAIYDGISTTISADRIMGGLEVLKITFSKDNRHSTACIDMTHMNETVALDSCKFTLHNLMWAPYDEIECIKED
jgi:hypothetical protein